MFRLCPFHLFLVFSVIACCVCASKASAEETWTQWRGPNRNGRIAETAWPDSLDETHLKEIWRVELPPSYSGPIVSEDTVFTTATKDSKEEVVYALDRKTGEEKWQTAWKGSMTVPFFAWSNGSWIRSTPALDEGKLYVGGMRDVLVCLDTKTGKEDWRLDFVKELETPLPSFGFVCSPLVMGDYLYVQAGGGLSKVGKSTGKIVWQSLKDGGGMYGSAFSSPTQETLAGREQLLVQTRKELAGVDPASGDVLWTEEIPTFRGMNILTPMVIENQVFTSAYGGKSHLFEIKADGEKMTSKEDWTNRVQGYMSSPIYHDGHIYLHLKNQRFTCIDAKTGETKWTTKPYGKYWSMVASGDKILALDERGELLLIRATPEKFDLLSERHISDATTWAYLTVCGDEIFVRDLTGLTAYQWK
jgi:outer membrane protein assembly factor BamB